MLTILYFHTLVGAASAGLGCGFMANGSSKLLSETIGTIGGAMVSELVYGAQYGLTGENLTSGIIEAFFGGISNSSFVGSIFSFGYQIFKNLIEG